MTKAQMLARIDELLPLCTGHVDSRAEPEHVLNGTLRPTLAAYGPRSPQIVPCSGAWGNRRPTDRDTTEARPS